MIATHADKCQSQECSHRVPHPENTFCHDGMCRWSSECRCVPDSKKEQVIEILKGYLCDDEGVPEIADAIDQIYKEATV